MMAWLGAIRLADFKDNNGWGLDLSYHRWTSNHNIDQQLLT
jgi:hypothetical protein